MAKNDIRLVIGFHRHLKIRKLHKTLGADGVLSLLVLWMYAAENRTSGLLHGLDARDIADASEWEGSPRRFIRTLVSIGLLDETDDGTMKIHDWGQHQPWISNAEARSEKARISARARWGPASIKENTDAERMPDACDADKVRNAPSPTPTPTPPPTPTPAPREEGDSKSPPPPSPPSDETKRDAESRIALDGASASANDNGKGQDLDQIGDGKDTTTASGKEKPGNGKGVGEYDNRLDFGSPLSLAKKAALQHALDLSSGGDNEAAIHHLKAARFTGRELARAVELLPGRMAN